MMLTISGLLFLGGVVTGVILNCLADDLPTGAGEKGYTVQPPRCHYCGATYSLPFWSALLATIFNRRQCEHCLAPRRGRAITVEIALGLGWVALWIWAVSLDGLSWAAIGRFIAAAIMTTCLLLIMVIDLEHRLVLYVVVAPSAIVMFLGHSLIQGRSPLAVSLGAAGGAVILLVMYWLGRAFALLIAKQQGQPLEEEAFGFGDVYLGGLIGMAVGWPAIVPAVLLGIFAGGAFAAIFVLIQKARHRYQPYMPIPYGPFLIFGAGALYFAAPLLPFAQNLCRLLGGVCP